MLYDVIASGYVPVITHPERLTYVESYYDQFLQAQQMGARA
jgi:protein-tyrosine phosphatase